MELSCMLEPYNCCMKKQRLPLFVCAEISVSNMFQMCIKHRGCAWGGGGGGVLDCNLLMLFWQNAIVCYDCCS